MCEFCRKIETMKEINSSYFTDEEMVKLGEVMGVKRVGKAEDVRTAVVIMAAIEVAMDNKLTLDDIKEAVMLAVARRMLRDLHHKEC